MKAKNIFNLAILGSLLLFSSCDESDLDLRYELGDVYDTEVGDIGSEDKLEYVVNGIYPNIGSSGFYGAQLQIFNDVVSDNVFVSNSNSGYNLNYQNLNWNEDSDLGFLNSGYNAISQTNVVINEQSLPDTPRTRSLKGEAKILRGFTYFTLIQLYANNPGTNHQEYGIPLNLGKYNPNLRLPRATVDEVYTQIIKDLTEGANEMDPGYRQGKKYMSPIAAKFILSKVYLTRGQAGDFDRAIALADEVLAAQAPIQSDKLYDYFTSTDITKSEGQPETVFEFEQTANYNIGVNASLGAFYSNTGGHRSLLTRQKVYDIFDANDIRRTLFNSSGTPATDTPKGFWLRKWPRNTSEGNYTMNIKILRFTEAKYIKMEAMAKNGQQAQALALLNEHALERGASPYSGDALTAIILDKQKEFIGEGHRFFDLKRNNLGFERTTNCLTCELPADSKYWVIPMPLSEMNRNPQMTQHPLW